MTWLDVTVVAIIAVSVVFGIFRGFIKEMLSLTTWVVAFWVASRYSHELASRFESTFPYPDLRVTAAFAALLLAVLIVGLLIRAIASRLVQASGVAGSDRTLGGIFGLLRGVVFVTIFVVAAGLTPFAHAKVWEDSYLAGHFKDLALWVADRWLGEAFDPPPVPAGKVG